MDVEAQLRDQAYGSFKNRALRYRAIFEELRNELGEPRVAELMKGAIAGRVDNGTFEAAGFEFAADTWTPGGEGCCHLHLRPGRATKG